MRNLEQTSGIGGGGLGNISGSKPGLHPLQTVDLKKALTDTILDLNAAFGRHWESTQYSQGMAFLRQPVGVSGATCNVPQRSYKGLTERSSGSTATIALVREGYELVIAQASKHVSIKMQLCSDIIFL